MKLLDIVLLAVILLAVIAAICYLRRKKPACGGNCAACPYRRASAGRRHNVKYCTASSTAHPTLIKRSVPHDRQPRIDRFSF